MLITEGISTLASVFHTVALVSVPFRWFFGTLNRLQAQSHLLAPENSEGAFLIRVSEKDNVGYVLSGETAAAWSVCDAMF